MVKYRDAGSGKYVTENYAKKHPKTTVSESDKPKPPTKPKGRK
ncbi:hypothetical protein [Legionella longbeachae]|nr:hypothetical protein [Legionella longbeachae]EEZ93448.1 conserved hypothetical protein [Legionella longbeachae D-4968]QIN34162.1 multidrug transporter [Legionella longbeachae]HBD7399129.1 multidrug transporter [Legionella pneumophila]